MKEFTYNFVRQESGRCAFARVKLSAEISSGINKVSLLLPENPNHRDCQVNFLTAPTWVGAVIDGALEALKFMAESTGVHYQVDVLDIRGSDVDSSDWAMRFAGAMAVLCCIKGESAESALDIKDGICFVNYQKI